MLDSEVLQKNNEPDPSNPRIRSMNCRSTCFVWEESTLPAAKNYDVALYDEEMRLCIRDHDKFLMADAAATDPVFRSRCRNSRRQRQ